MAGVWTERFSGNAGLVKSALTLADDSPLIGRQGETHFLRGADDTLADRTNAGRGS